jgi:hypothetical protein
VYCGTAFDPIDIIGLNIVRSSLDERIERTLKPLLWPAIRARGSCREQYKAEVFLLKNLDSAKGPF